MKSAKVTVEKAFAGFVAHLRANGYSPHTVRSYRCDLAKLERFSQDRPIDVSDFSAGRLAEFLNAHAEGFAGAHATPSRGAQNRLRAVLRSFFSWLHKTGQIKANPAACLRVHVYRPPAPQIMSRGQYERLRSALGAADNRFAKRDLVLVELLAGTGLRVSEAARLDIRDLDLAGATVSVRTKAGVVEKRLLNRRLVRMLRAYIADRAEAPLFPNGRGGHISSRHIQRRIEGWLRRAGLDGSVTPHTFRHTLATRLLERTGDLRLVQRALGHRSILSTLRYTQVADRALRAALEAV